jgi:Protein of unknown function (DUF1583)
VSRLACLLALLAATSPLSAAEPGVFRADFRGKPVDERLFEKVNFDEDAQTEPEGLRIALGGRSRGATRLRANFCVKGDFEFTFAYELIVAEPVDTQRVGVTMYVHTAGSDTAAFFARFNYQDGSKVYRTTLPRSINGTRVRPALDTLATGTAGRLRMVRRGSDLTCLAAEAGSDEFTKIESDPEFGSEDLHAIRISAEKDGGPATKYAARFLELEIRSPASFAADGTPLFPEAAGNDSRAATSPSGRGRLRPVLYVFLGLGAIVVLAIIRRALTKNRAAKSAGLSEQSGDRP